MPGKKKLITQAAQETEEPGQAEARFRAMFDTATVGIGIMSLDRRIIDANPAMCRMLGLTREELIGQTPATATYPEDYARATEDFNDLLTGKKDSYQVERRYVRKNGVAFWTHVTMSVVHDASGNPLYLVGMVVDIDEQKQVLAELKQSEARLRTIYENASVGIALVGLDGHPLSVNPAVLSMTGYTEQELLGLFGLELSHPDDRAAASGPMRELIEGKRDAFQSESRFVCKSGQVYWVRQRISSVRGADGKPAYLVVMIEDIDEQKHMLAAIQESESRFRAMFESSAIGTLILDVKNLTLRYNAVARSLLDDPELPDTLADLYDFIHVRYRESERDKFTELLNGQRDSYTTDRSYHRQGEETIWSHVTFSTVKDIHGELRYIVGMMENITEQKADQQKLVESEARFRAMFEYATLGIVIGNVDKQPIAVNEAMAEMLGYPRDILLNTPGMDVTYFEDKALGQHEFRQLVDGEINSYQLEKRLAHKDGHPIWVRQTVSSVRDPQGKTVYWVSMVENIDAQKRTLMELQKSEARFRAMFDNVSVGMSLMSLERRVLAINQTAEEIIGYKLDELVDKDPAFLSLPEDRLIGSDQFQEMIIGQRDGFQMEKRYVRKDGTVFWARVTYSLVRNPDGKPLNLIGLIEDIDEQKLAADKLAAQEVEYLRTLEQRVEERTRELSEANLRLVNEIEQRQRAEETLASKAVEEAILAERTRLARDLHDAVTQTLFSASLIAEVLPELWQVDPEEARKSNEELRQLTRGALAEMRTLLLELRPATLTQARFPDLLKQLGEAVIGRARLPVDLVVEGNYELPPEVKVAFYRIAQESLNNIVKYSRATHVEMCIKLDCCNVHLEVKDNGVGFDPASIKPTSLGMRIMRERAEAIHAHFRVSSVPGQGTTVIVDWNEDELIPISTIPTLRGNT
jgi:PAS domain S-box-containing protein